MTKFVKKEIVAKKADAAAEAAIAKIEKAKAALPAKKDKPATIKKADVTIKTGRKNGDLVAFCRDNKLDPKKMRQKLRDANIERTVAGLQGYLASIKKADTKAAA